MKGNDKLIGALNQLLADELTAISQYMVHSEMCASWGYEKLHKAIEGRRWTRGTMPSGSFSASSSLKARRLSPSSTRSKSARAYRRW